MNYAWACSNTLWPYHHCHEGKPADLIAIFLALVCDPLKVLGKYLSNEIRAECSACTLQNHEREAQHFRETQRKQGDWHHQLVWGPYTQRTWWERHQIHTLCEWLLWWNLVTACWEAALPLCSDRSFLGHCTSYWVYFHITLVVFPPNTNPTWIWGFPCISGESNCTACMSHLTLFGLIDH
jgi:hypothetical protein